MSKVAEYINEAKAELKKVQWPTRKETTRHTVLVILISIGVAIFLGLFDYLFNIVLETLIS